jgi:hypothetical protein
VLQLLEADYGRAATAPQATKQKHEEEEEEEEKEAKAEDACEAPKAVVLLAPAAPVAAAVARPSASLLQRLMRIMGCGGDDAANQVESTTAAAKGHTGTFKNKIQAFNKSNTIRKEEPITCNLPLLSLCCVRGFGFVF